VDVVKVAGTSKEPVLLVVRVRVLLLAADDEPDGEPDTQGGGGRPALPVP
jgi:hypothetical protein